MALPKGVKVLAILAIGFGVYSVIFGFGFFVMAAIEDPTVSFARVKMAMGVGTAVWGVFIGFVGYGLWTLRNWARLVTISLSLLFFVATIFFAYLNAFGCEGERSDLLLFVQIVYMVMYGGVILYLRRATVSEAFSKS